VQGCILSVFGVESGTDSRANFAPMCILGKCLKKFLLLHFIRAIYESCSMLNN